jgi:pimeloyl-ACP methyl ester carboxylesterase
MGESYMWYPAFDSAFNSLPPAAADPSGTVAKLRALLESLAWSTEDVHLFGFAQGGGMALALALSLASDPINESRRLGSVVTVLGGLEGKTPSAPKSLSHTPVLFYTRTPADPRAAAVKDRFAQVTVFTAPSRGSMPASMDEWRPIMGFWGQVLKRDEAWKGGEVYEVVRE